jgi:hypothetical protein
MIVWFILVSHNWHRSQRKNDFDVFVLFIVLRASLRAFLNLTL